MQTFLPYSSFRLSAITLDRLRLGKQRVEAYQLMLLMSRPEQKGWRNHPAFKIWDGYDVQLIEYGITMCDEWIERGYTDNLRPKFLELLKNCPYNNPELPPIIGRKDFHSSHRSALLFKKYDWYSAYGWEEEPKLDYVWI